MFKFSRYAALLLGLAYGYRRNGKECYVLVFNSKCCSTSFDVKSLKKDLDYSAVLLQCIFLSFFFLIGFNFSFNKD